MLEKKVSLVRPDRIRQKFQESKDDVAQLTANICPSGSSGVTFSQASTSVSMTVPSFSRTRPVAPLSRQQVHLLLPHGLEEGGDDGIVPSTPTLYVPRRSDGFGEAVSSPVVPTGGRFSFNEPGASSGAGSNEVVLPEQTLEIANVDDNGESGAVRGVGDERGVAGTGRSVPTTPLRASPQEAGPSAEEQSAHQAQSEGEAFGICLKLSGSYD